MLYGAEFMVPSKTMLKKMQAFWNRVMRWITNGFYATNISVLSAEACLAPVAVYAEQVRSMTAVRLATALPENNIATAMFPQSFPIQDEFRVATHRRMAFDLNKGGMRPKTWSSKCTTTAQV